MRCMRTVLISCYLHCAFGRLWRNNLEELGYNSLVEKATHEVVEGEVKFVLYTRRGPKQGELITRSAEVLLGSGFDASHDTKFVIHGFQSSGSSDTCQEIKDKYLQLYDYNVFVIDWSQISGNLIYFIPATSTRQIGEYFASIIDLLVSQGADPDKIHLIGHSLGAHIAGFAGEYASVNVSRITGLDPAFPSFGMIQLANGRLNQDQAKFVDVIHTAAGVFGLMDAVGHADFYPNGGTMSQPGCNGITDIMAACSHGSSWKYFKESIDERVKYPSYKCASYEDFIGSCLKVDAVFMGEHLNRSTRGIFYLTTKPEPPYTLI